MAESIHVEPLVIKGESHSKSNVTKIGGGAALGAVIGAIAGGGKGAAIGTLAGGAAGTGAAAATGKKPAIVESEAVLTFVTSSASASATPPPASPSANEAADAAPAPCSLRFRAHHHFGLAAGSQMTAHSCLPCAIAGPYEPALPNMPPTFRLAPPSGRNCPPDQNGRSTAVEACLPRFRARPSRCLWSVKSSCPNYPATSNGLYMPGGCF